MEPVQRRDIKREVGRELDRAAAVRERGLVVRRASEPAFARDKSTTYVVDLRPGHPWPGWERVVESVRVSRRDADDEPLSVLDGLDAAGEWRLEVVDVFEHDLDHVVVDEDVNGDCPGVGNSRVELTSGFAGRVEDAHKSVKEWTLE